MRHNTTLTLKRLQAEARAVLKARGLTQQDVADELDKSRVAVNRALNSDSDTFEAILLEIIERWSDYRAVREPVFRYHIVRKDAE